MTPFNDANFWSNFWSNALSEILFGVVFAAVFTLLFNHALNRRRVAELHLVAAMPIENQETRLTLYNWPVPSGGYAYTNVQLGLENTGTVAAVNWLVKIALIQCTDAAGRFLVEFAPLRPADANSGSLQIARDKALGTSSIEFRYKTASDIVHSGAKNRSDPNMQFGILFYDGFEGVMTRTRLWRSPHTFLQKDGVYEIYADHMKPKRNGHVHLQVDTQTGQATIYFS